MEMCFSDEIYISKVQRREPKDKAEWMAEIARILLPDRKKSRENEEDKDKKPKNE